MRAESGEQTGSSCTSLSFARARVPWGRVLAAGWAWREWTWTTPGPGARERHSFHLFDNQVFVFGGRANDIVVPHTPKTYQIVNVNGTLQFETYDQKPVTECVNQTLEECYDIPIGLFFNDIWRYDLGAFLLLLNLPSPEPGGGCGELRARRRLLKAGSSTSPSTPWIAPPSPLARRLCALVRPPVSV